MAWVATPEGDVHTATWSNGLDRVPLADEIQQVLATGQSRFLPNLSSATVRTSPAGDAADVVPADFSPRSAVLIPLLARGRTLGALLLAMGFSGRRHGPADLALAEDLAGRAAIALDNARLYRNIQASDQRKNEFLSMLAHELRNPL